MSDDEKDVEMQEVKVAVEEVEEAEGPGAEEEPKETKKKKKKKKPKSSKEQDEEKAKQAEEEHHRSSFHRAETVTAASGDAGMKSLRAHYLDRKSLIDAQKSTCCLALREKFHDKYDVYCKMRVYPFKISLQTKVMDDTGTDCEFTHADHNHVKFKAKWPDEKYSSIDYEPYCSVAVFDKEKVRDEKLGDCKINIGALFKNKKKKMVFEGILSRDGVELGDKLYAGDVFIKGMWDGTDLNLEISEVKNLVERSDIKAVKNKGGGSTVLMALIAVLVYLAMGLLFFTTAMPVHGPVYKALVDADGQPFVPLQTEIVLDDAGEPLEVDERFSAVEAIYFSIYTLTTVGYGDSRIIGQAYNDGYYVDVDTPIGPNHAAMWFTSFFILVGIGGIAAALGIVGDHVMEKIQDAAATGISNEEDEFEDEDENAMVKIFTKPNRCKGCIVATPSSAWAFLGILALMTGFNRAINQAAEGDDEVYWEWSLSFYYAVVTMTTVGYGDIGTSNETAYVVGIFFMIFGTLATAKAIGDVLGLYFDAQTAKRRQLIMDTAFQTEADIQFFDEDGDGDVSEYEFVSKMLVKLKLVAQSEIDKLHIQYTSMDADGDGDVGIDEIRQLFNISTESKRTVDVKMTARSTGGVFAAAVGGH